jgi:hypothetical protein
MRQRLAQLTHANQTRLRLERAEAEGTISPSDQARLHGLRSRLLTDLIEEVVCLSRDLTSLQSRARRPFGA